MLDGIVWTVSWTSVKLWLFFVHKVSLGTEHSVMMASALDLILLPDTDRHCHVLQHGSAMVFEGSGIS